MLVEQITAGQRTWLRARAPGLHKEKQNPAVERPVPLPPAPSARVAILLAAVPGQRRFDEQLDSLLAQTHRNWIISASDARTRVDAHDVLRLLPPERLALRPSAGGGFLSQLLAADVEADYYACSAPDDVWDADRLAHALAMLAEVPAHVPAMYCSRTRLVDETGRRIGHSPLFARTPGFANALVQNISGGNTLILNAAARRLLVRAGLCSDIVSDGWWAYMAVTACGGRVLFDPRPSVRYCQPGVGRLALLGCRLQRARLLLSGRLRDWSDRHVRALAALPVEVTPKNRIILHRFTRAREASLLQRLVGMRRAGIYTQSALGNLALFTAAVFNRV